MRRFDRLAQQLGAVLDVDDAIRDGEVIAADETGRPQFLELLRGTRPPTFVAFDVILLNGTDLRPLPLHERAGPPGHHAEGITNHLRGARGRGQGVRAVRRDVRERSGRHHVQAPCRAVCPAREMDQGQKTQLFASGRAQ